MSKVTLKKVEIEVEFGTTIREAYKNAIKACLDYECDVEFTFNSKLEIVRIDDVIKLFNVVAREKPSAPEHSQHPEA